MNKEERQQANYFCKKFTETKVKMEMISYFDCLPIDKIRAKF